MRKMLAVVKFELIIQSRQRIILTSAALVSFIFAVVVFLYATTLSKQLQGNSEIVKFQLSTIVIISFFVQVLSYTVALLPIFTADTFSRDWQFRTAEIMLTMPVSRSQLILGKMCSGILGSFLNITIISLAIMVIWYIAVYPYNILNVCTIWLLTIAPMAITQPAITTLLFSRRRVRRTELIFSVIFSVAIFFLIYAGAVPLGVAWYDFINPSRPLIIKFLSYYPIPREELLNHGITSINGTDIVITILAAFIELVMVFCLSLFLYRRRLHYL